MPATRDRMLRVTPMMVIIAVFVMEVVVGVWVGRVEFRSALMSGGV